MPFALDDLDSNYLHCQKLYARRTTPESLPESTYLRQHVRGGGGCHLDRCEKREAYASRMKGAGFSSSAGSQRYRVSVGDDV
jgi:hypothetical protein